MTDTRAHDFIKLHDDGVSYREIGVMHGISRERVRQILDVAYPVEGRRRTAVQKCIDRMMPDKCVTASQAAVLMECEKKTAYYRMRSRGVAYYKVMTGPGVDPEKLRRYEGYASKNMSAVDVARLEGIAQPSVTRFCKKNGIKLRDGRKK